MVYREHANDVAAAERSDDPDQSLVAFDASGSRGQNGWHGFDGGGGGTSGADGADGGHAGAAQRGFDAGSLRIELRPGYREGVAWIGGQRTASDGVTQQIHEELDFGEAGYIDLVARGGAGGRGGNGGDGGAGATGSRGSDATRYRSGSNGGPGGDGGDGGRATSGADGGHGGAVQVEVAADDTHLLMLLRHHIQGGQGGAPGLNGSGGGRRLGRSWRQFV